MSKGGYIVTGDGKGTGLKIWQGQDGLYTEGLATVVFNPRSTSDQRRALRAGLAEALARIPASPLRPRSKKKASAP